MELRQAGFITFKWGADLQNSSKLGGCKAWKPEGYKAKSNMAWGFILEVRANAGILLFQTGNNQVNFQIN